MKKKKKNPKMWKKPPFLKQGRLGPASKGTFGHRKIGEKLQERLPPVQKTGWGGTGNPWEKKKKKTGERMHTRVTCKRG